VTRAAERLARFLTVQQTAEALDVATKTVRRWITTGELRVHRLGRSIRIAEPDLLAFLKRKRDA
jgi:excisionase family DNA binding protein